MRIDLFSTPIRSIDNRVDNSQLHHIVGAVEQYKQKIIDDPRFDRVRGFHRPLMTNNIIENVCDHVSELKWILSAIDSDVQRYASELVGASTARATVSHAWLAYQGSGHYVQRHNHTFVTGPNGAVDVMHINAIFYIQATDQDTLHLYYPHQNMVLTAGVRSVSGMVAHAVVCKTNRLVMIPSWMDHSVDARPREQEKIAFSINYKVTV